MGNTHVAASMPKCLQEAYAYHLPDKVRRRRVGRLMDVYKEHFGGYALTPALQKRLEALFAHALEKAGL